MQDQPRPLQQARLTKEYVRDTFHVEALKDVAIDISKGESRWP